MSSHHQKSNNLNRSSGVSAATTTTTADGCNIGNINKKLIDEDKYESTDSGFISSGNLLVSGEILTEEPDEGNQKNLTTPIITTTTITKEQDEDNYMRLDSGVDLAESFSGLNLKSPGLNDLSKKYNSDTLSSTTTTTTPPPPTTTTKSTPVVESCETQQSYEDDPTWGDYFQQDENGDTLLHKAIDQGFIEIALTLIRLTPHPLLLDTPNDNAETPAHLAALTRQSKILRWLIVAGAKPLPRNKNGDSPLHIAVRNNDIDCCKAITDPVQEKERELLILNYQPIQPYYQINLEQWNYEGQTCIHIAAINGHINILRHLIWLGADINAREGRTGYTALHYAIQQNNEQLIQFLLNECKQLNVQILTYGGCSPLQLGNHHIISDNIYHILTSRGVATPHDSSNDEEDDDIDSSSDSENEHEMLYENTKTYLPNLVNASA